MKLYNANFSPNALRVRAVAHELGVDLEIVQVDIRAGDNRAAEFLARNPNAKVPVLEDGNFVLWESQAICRYLADTYATPPWAPEDAVGRALAGQWMDWYITKMHPPMTVIFWALIRTAPEDRDMDAVDKAVGQAAELWTLLDAQLAKADFLTGDEPTMADIPAGCSVNRWYAMEVERPNLPNLEAWHGQLKERPAYQDHVIMPLV